MRTEVISIDPDAHDWSDGVVTQNPTCTTRGFLTYTCANDPTHTYEDSIPIDPNAHTWDDGVVTIPAVCCAEGEMTYTCVECCCTRTEPISIDPNAHNWDDGVVTTAATCAAEGVITFTCANDPRHTRTDVIPIDPGAHDWYDCFVSKEPTCAEEGVITYICANDPGHTCTEAIDPLGHDFDDTIAGNVTIVPATTSAPGSKTVKCSRCEETQTTEIPILLPEADTAQFVVSGGKAYRGQEVQVTVSVRNNPGIVATLLKLSYDPAVLTLVKAEKGGVITGGTFTIGDSLAAIPYTVILEDSLAQTNYTQDGDLVVFTFRVKADAPLGETAVSVTYDAPSTYDKDLIDRTFTVQNGAVLVAERVPGDASGDGELNVKDATILRRYLAGWEGVEIDEICADFNGDGSVDLKDVTLILRYLAGWVGVTPG